jgi:glycosyltransferase involved in cell wall biosynthesis
VRVVIDGRALVGNRTGIGVHTAEIARRLAVGTAPLIATHTRIENVEGLEHCDFRVDERELGVLWQQTVLPGIDGDVLWGPHGTLPLSLRRPAVVTLHDLTPITMPGRHRWKTIVSFNPFIAQSLDAAARVACVSRAVADEALRGFAIPSSKIVIVPNGVDEFFTPAVDLAEEGSYILYAGTLEPRKGLGDLIAAWSALPEPRPRLVLCGDPGWKTTVPLMPGLEITGYVSRERLRELYRGARAFVYPSLYEGFGMPPLEAMACGAPVIATRTGAISEYAERAALLVAPGRVDELQTALKRLLGDPSLRRELRRAGPERAGQWRWGRSAALMQELFAEAMR